MEISSETERGVVQEVRKLLRLAAEDRSELVLKTSKKRILSLRYLFISEGASRRLIHNGIGEGPLSCRDLRPGIHIEEGCPADQRCSPDDLLNPSGGHRRIDDQSDVLDHGRELRNRPVLSLWSDKRQDCSQVYLKEIDLGAGYVEGL